MILIGELDIPPIDMQSPRRLIGNGLGIGKGKFWKQSQKGMGFRLK